jgi:iron complex outermembrane recepter protein
MMNQRSSWLSIRSLSARVLVAAASSSIIMLSAPALAQTSANPAADVQAQSDNGLAEIVVTAERRSQRLQDVPISITALSSSALENAGIASTMDLSELTPGLVSPPSLSGNQALTPFIRGIGSATAIAGYESSVALYVDGVYSASIYSNEMDLANVDRVEILKGPQGTLYGRNATGGAINVITKAPSDQLQGDASVSYGRFNETVEKGYLTGPLAPQLDASFSIVGRQGGNWGNNDFTGNKFGGLDSIAMNAQLAWKPIEQFSANASVFYQESTSRRADIDQVAPPGIVPIGGQLGGLYSTNPNVSYTNVDPVKNTTAYTGMLHLKYSLNDVDFVSISGYKRFNLNATLDADGTSLPILGIHNYVSNSEFTQEVQVLSTGPSRFQWIVGAYYISFREQYDPFEIDVAPLNVAYWTKPYTSGESGYAQGTYELTPGTKLTAGVRYSAETKSISGTLQAPTLDDLVLAGPIHLSTTYEKPTWRVSLQQVISPGLNAYASYNRGFKSGGYNSLSIDPNLQPVKPESLDAYEVGLKSEFAGAVQLNAAAYYYDYTNIQVQHVLVGSGTAAAVLENAAAAKLYGVDADLVIAPIRGVRLTAGINLEHSRYSSFDDASGFIISNGAGVAASFDYTGKQLIGAPNVTFNVGGSYKVDLANFGAVTPYINYSYSSSYLEAPGEGNSVNAFGQLSARVAWTDPRDRYSVEFWGQNLTNVRAYGEYTAALLVSQAVLPPLSFGVTLSAKF